MSFMFKYESIFDHNPTKEELAAAGYETQEDIERRKKYAAEADSVDFWSLCRLFQRRGQIAKVNEYLQRAKKEGFKDLFTLRHELAGGCIQI